MASIHDVAKKAGVAKSTVSKVLNGYRMVSDETKEKVEKAVKELGYIPNSYAVSLSKKEFRRIGLIVDIRHNRQFVDEIGMQYLTGAFEQSKVCQMETVTYFTSQFDEMPADEVAAYLRAQQINGLIIFDLSIENLNFYQIVKDQLFYTVLVDSPIANQKTSSVSIDHRKAQYDVAKRTLQENIYIQKILYIAGGKSGYITNLRLKGINELQKEMKFELTVTYGDFDEYTARSIVFEYAEDIDIIICASDLMAIGAVNALKEMDIFRPVCGFDGIALMGYTKILMNTVRQDFKGKSIRAFDEMKRLMEGQSGRHVEIPYEICKIDYMDIIKKYSQK